MLVVDANVVVYSLLESEMTAPARALWTADPDWHAPRLLFYELANVLSRLVGNGAISRESAVRGLGDGAALVKWTSEPPASRVLDMACVLGISAYDASYLAAAEALQVPLVTEDRRLLAVAPQIARSLRASLM